MLLQIKRDDFIKVIHDVDPDTLKQIRLNWKDGSDNLQRYLSKNKTITETSRLINKFIDNESFIEHLK